MMNVQEILLKHLQEDGRSANRMAEERFQKLVENIRETGRTQPLTVRPHPTDKNQWIIIDGHYRFKALQELGWENAPCDIWPVSEEEATLLLATLNRLRGEDHPLKRAELIQTLLSRFEETRLAALLPESAGEIQKLLSLLKQREDDRSALVEKLQAQREAQAKTLPTILSFVLSKSDADQVQARLDELDPDDKNRALVLLCMADPQLLANDDDGKAQK